MPAQIIKVQPSKLDQDCMEVTLRLLPNRLEQWLGQKEKVVTFKGQGNSWYRYPCFTPVSGKLAKLLKSINRGWEFRHIQYQYKQQLNKAC